jgi:hypothetical protein
MVRTIGAIKWWYKCEGISPWNFRRNRTPASFGDLIDGELLRL